MSDDTLDPANAHRCRHGTPTTCSNCAVERSGSDTETLREKLAVATEALRLVEDWHHETCPEMEGGDCRCAHLKISATLEKLEAKE